MQGGATWTTAAVGAEGGRAGTWPWRREEGRALGGGPRRRTRALPRRTRTLAPGPGLLSAQPGLGPGTPLFGPTGPQSPEAHVTPEVFTDKKATECRLPTCTPVREG